MKKGAIDISELKNLPEQHELNTAHIFSEHGKQIKFIRPSNIKGNHMPDFWMDGKMWEIKSPTGQGKTMIKNLFHEAVRQSGNIIFDLRRTKLNDDECIAKIKQEMSRRNKKYKVLVIMKNHSILDISN